VLRVVEIQPDSVRVDANHPLAGVSLHYSVEVTDVRAATDEEITQAAADFDDVMSEIVSEEEPFTLLQLGTKKDDKKKVLH
jgi:FKBP-type peptidyl-prolyl cis-trans isomerase 2